MVEPSKLCLVVELDMYLENSILTLSLEVLEQFLQKILDELQKFGWMNTKSCITQKCLSLKLYHSEGNFIIFLQEKATRRSQRILVYFQHR